MSNREYYDPDRAMRQNPLAASYAPECGEAQREALYRGIGQTAVGSPKQPPIFEQIMGQLDREVSRLELVEKELTSFANQFLGDEPPAPAIGQIAGDPHLVAGGGMGEIQGRINRIGSIIRSCDQQVRRIRSFI